MRFHSLALSAVLILAMAGASHAAKKPHPSVKPRPAQVEQNQPKKVWTNDDLAELRAHGLISIVGQEAPAQAAPAVPAEVTFPVYESRLDDPTWYAEKAAELQSALDDAIAALQQEQNALALAKDRVTEPGVALDKPSIGVTPDAALALFQAQVDGLQMQLDELGDLARQHGIPPGVLRGEAS
jgi:hypothetical protein